MSAYLSYANDKGQITFGQGHNFYVTVKVSLLQIPCVNVNKFHEEISLYFEVLACGQLD